MQPDAYEGLRALFREAFDTDIEDKDEVRALAAVVRWTQSKMEREKRQQVTAGAIFFACISAFAAAVFANLQSIWNFIHGK